MLAKAKAKTGMLISYICADSCPCRWQMRSAMRSVCYSSLPHFPDKPQALLEIKRVLKKGGQLSSAIPQPGTHQRDPPADPHGGQNDLLPDAIE